MTVATGGSRPIDRQRFVRTVASSRTDGRGVTACGKESEMAKAKLGSGARFKSLKTKLASKGARNPGALAAYIGREKYGAAKMAKLSAKGRSKHK